MKTIWGVIEKSPINNLIDITSKIILHFVSTNIIFANFDIMSSLMHYYVLTQFQNQ